MISLLDRISFPPSMISIPLHLFLYPLIPLSPLLRPSSFLLPPPSSLSGPNKITQSQRETQRETFTTSVTSILPIHPSMGDPVCDPASIPKVVSILSSLLERVAERNDATTAAVSSSLSTSPTSAAMVSHGAALAFQGLTKPAISVRDYLERIFRFASCSPSCYVVAYIYLDRYLQRHPSVTLDSLNVHRFLITSVLTAVKFVDDM